MSQGFYKLPVVQSSATKDERGNRRVNVDYPLRAFRNHVRDGVDAFGDTLARRFTTFQTPHALCMQEVEKKSGNGVQGTLLCFSNLPASLYGRRSGYPIWAEIQALQHSTVPLTTSYYYKSMPLGLATRLRKKSSHSPLSWLSTRGVHRLASR